MIVNNEILAGLIDGSPYPIYLILGDELIVAVANAATLKACGKRFSDALPELNGQPFEQLLRKVISTGKPYYAVNDRAEFIIDGQKKVSYFTFSYQPLVDIDGSISGVVCYATDVTNLVESAEKIRELGNQANKANEQLTQSNQKLEAFNEELATANQELAESNHLLELSELRFRNLISQAPFSICVIRAKDLIVTDVNDRYLNLVRKKREQLDGLSIWQGVPEAAKAYGPIMEEVISSGKAFSAKEARLMLVREGISEEVYLDFIYEPVIDPAKNVSAIMVVGIDVSEKVNTRKAIEEAEERIRLATEAADIGTYEYQYDSGTFLTSSRFNEIVGLEHGMSRSDVIKYYHPDDANLSAKAHKEAKETGKVFYEARFIRNGQPLKWLRFQAKVYFDSKGLSEKTLGTVIDITEYKAIQQQKDDFISIASHELKTPVTSLKASLQLLTKMKENLNPVVFPKLLDKATRSMEKISELVDDLLNVSKMNQGQIALQKNWFTLANMIERSCDHVRESPDYELVLEGELDLLVFADEHRIEQVMVNFVNNAVKYAPKSYRIFIRVEKHEETAKISVRDTGPGISEDLIPQIFERYYRADASGKQVSGLGLGLYICAEIIERHGGQIGVESEIGIGSSFWFTLPLGM
jgi:signal transduction histidine kinase